MSVWILFAWCVGAAAGRAAFRAEAARKKAVRAGTERAVSGPSRNPSGRAPPWAAVLRSHGSARRRALLEEKEEWRI